MRPTVWTSFAHPATTGAGLVQRELTTGLRSRGFEVITGQQPRGFETNWSARAHGWSRENLSALRHRDAIGLITATPAPLAQPRRSILLVYDLRWTTTRLRASRLYRSADLKVSARRARAVCTGSQPVARDVEAHTGVASRVIRFGPGRAGAWEFTDGGNGDVILVGSGVHKRNELAAELLATHHRWFQRVVTVNVSDATRMILDRGLGRSRVRHHDYISDDELRAVMESATFFVHLGRHEGFGFPYLEALAAGCQVIAINYPVTKHLLGEAATLTDEPLDKWFDQLNRGAIELPTTSVRRQRIESFSWDVTCDAFARLIEEVGTNS